MSTLAEPFDMTLPTVVQHLAMLKEVGIVSSQKAGRVRTYQLVPDGLVTANAWIVDQRTPQTRQLDRLGDFLSRNIHNRNGSLMTSTSTKHSQVHNTFVIERTYPVPVADVWHAMTDNEARDHWFGGGVNESFDAEESSHEFKVGGGGFETGRWHNGPETRFTSTYTNIVDQERFVYTYDLSVDAGHLSTSLTTAAMEAVAEGTHLTFTEQGVHYDGLDSPAQREEGTNGLLDQLGEYLTAE